MPTVFATAVHNMAWHVISFQHLANFWRYLHTTDQYAYREALRKQKTYGIFQMLGGGQTGLLYVLTISPNLI